MAHVQLALPDYLGWQGTVEPCPLWGSSLPFFLKKVVAPSLSLSYYYHLGGVSVSWLVGAGVGESIHELKIKQERRLWFCKGSIFLSG